MGLIVLIYVKNNNYYLFYIIIGIYIFIYFYFLTLIYYLVAFIMIYHKPRILFILLDKKIYVVNLYIKKQQLSYNF